MTLCVAAWTAIRASVVSGDKILALRTRVIMAPLAADRASTSSAAVQRIERASYANWNGETRALVIPAKTEDRVVRVPMERPSSVSVVQGIVVITARPWLTPVVPIRVYMEDNA